MDLYTVILDTLILIVLCLTIIFCLRLNARIVALQNNKAELEGFIKSLDTVIINSHKSINNLKDMTEKADSARRKYVNEANELANDLSFMISSGNRLIQRFDEGTRDIEETLAKIEFMKKELAVYIDDIDDKVDFVNRQKKVKHKTN
jgi:hypothetical protein